MAESVTITDNRTGESIEIPIVDGGVDAGSWRKLLGNIARVSRRRDTIDQPHNQRLLRAHAAPRKDQIHRVTKPD